MLATQSADGVLRVWSVAKVPHQDIPRVIRVLESTEIGNTSQNWFAWSKNGRLVNYADGDAKAWDVRTKRVTNISVPVVDNVIAITNYGPTGTLFTVSQNHGVQQYDLVAPDGPRILKQVFHVPPNAPPTPPRSTEIDRHPRLVAMKQPKITSSSNIPIQIDTDTSGVDTSEDEGPVLSPLQRIAKEMDDLEDERRDQLAPLSPVSSRASMSSASSYGRPRRHRQKSSSAHSRSSGGSGGTVFSSGMSVSERSGNDTMSIRSGTSVAPSIDTRGASARSRQQTIRNPQGSSSATVMELFPYTKARLGEVKFRPPRYDQEENSPDQLRQEMLSVVFGWHDDIEELIRDEQARHLPGTGSAVLLSKWMGDSGADAMAQMMGSQSMTSADWMLLALTNSMGQGSQKQMGEAFVKRLLEGDEVHPAVAILLGLGETNEAVEVYVSRKFYMEATLLACLAFPHDWGRISHLVRKWGEVAVGHGQPELAVRCFSCTSIECSEPWFSPRAQDLTYQAQQQLMAPDEPLQSPQSPPSAGSNRMTAKNASLKLITSFGSKGEPKPARPFGETPIADTATTPSARRATSRGGFRDLSQARTATPGGYGRNRMPSTSREEDPHTAVPGVPSRRPTPAMSEMSEEPETAVEMSRAPFRPSSRTRAGSADRNVHGLSIITGSTVGSRSGTMSAISANTSVHSMVSRGRHGRTNSSYSKLQAREQEVAPYEEEGISPAMPTGDSMQSYKGRSIDRYIDSLEVANSHAQQLRTESRSRGENREDRGNRSQSRHRPRDASAARSEFSIGGRARRSPTSPKSMTAEEAKPRRREASQDVDTRSARPRASSKMSSSRLRDESPEIPPGLRSRSKAAGRNASRGPSRRATPEILPGESEHVQRQRYSPTSPAAMGPMSALRTRGERSTSRRPTPRAEEQTSRARSASRKPQERFAAEPEQDSASDEGETRHARSSSRKEQAAKELEQRRLSLARRPSAPPILDPNQYSRPNMSPRSFTDGELLSSKSFVSIYEGGRSQTVDPEAMLRHTASSRGGPSAPIGLPANPKATRNAKYEYEIDDVPNVPLIPDNATTLAPISYQPFSQQTPDAVADLLPSSVYSSKRPPVLRSASAPPEKMSQRSRGKAGSPKQSPVENRFRGESNASPHESPRASRAHNFSQPSDDYSRNTFLDTANDDHIVIVPDSDAHDPHPAVLTELAHLSGPPPPPPPPPPPTMCSQPPPPPPLQTQIHHSHTQSTTSQPSPLNTGMHPHPLTMSNLHRRNSSITATQAQDPQSAISGSSNPTSRWARVADKMRSQSRSRNNNKDTARSPAEATGQSPYETLLPTAFARTKSPSGFSEAASTRGNTPAPALAPYETVYESPEKKQGQMLMQGQMQAPLIPGMTQAFGNTVTMTSSSAIRNPKEIRANMPKEPPRANMPPMQLQRGVDS